MWAPLRTPTMFTIDKIDISFWHYKTAGIVHRPSNFRKNLSSHLDKGFELRPFISEYPAIKVHNIVKRMPSAWLDDMPPIAFKLGHYLNAKMTSWGGTNMASAMLFYLFAQSTSLLPAPAFQNENLVNFAAAYNLGCHRNSNVVQHSLLKSQR